MSKLPRIPRADLEAFVTGSRRLAEGTRRNYLRGVQQWIDYAGEDPNTWTPQRARAFYDHLLDTVSTIAANQAVVGVRYLLGRIEKDYPGRFISPMRAVELAKIPEGEAQRALTPSEARALLRACDDSSDMIARRDWAIVMLGLATGLRRAGLCDINLDRVRHDNPRHTTYLKITLKGGTPYEVPVANRIWAMVYHRWLQPQLPVPTSGPMFRRIGRVAVGTSQRKIFPTGLTEDGLFKALAKRAAMASLVDFHPHILRHTMITWLRQGVEEASPRKPAIAELPFDKIDVITGHKTGGMAKRVYTDLLTIAPPIAEHASEVVLRNLGLA